MKKFLRIFLSVLIIVLLVAGIQIINNLHRDNEELTTKNKSLENKIESLQITMEDLNKEILKSKQTAGYHFQQGTDLVLNINYEAAKIEFQIILDSFPKSPFIIEAQRQLELIRKEIAKIEFNRKQIYFNELIAEAKEVRKLNPFAAGEGMIRWAGLKVIVDSDFENGKITSAQRNKIYLIVLGYPAR